MATLNDDSFVTQQDAFQDAGLFGTLYNRPAPNPLPPRGETEPAGNRPWYVGAYFLTRSKFVAVAICGEPYDSRQAIKDRPCRYRRVYWDTFNNREEAERRAQAVAAEYSPAAVWHAKPMACRRALTEAFLAERLLRRDRSEPQPHAGTPNPLPVRLRDRGQAFRREQTAYARWRAENSHRLAS